ncbi:MAG: DUF3322 domain-containing protein [Methylococcales bacterium]
MTWGLLPADVVAEIERREWQNSRNLRARLCGERSLPLRIALKAPTGEQALADLEHFRLFIANWKNWPHPNQLHWQRRKYQRLGEHEVPVALQIDSMPELIALLGPQAETRSRGWKRRMGPLLAMDSRLSKALLKNLDTIESMSEDDAVLLAKALPQLRPDMGLGLFLRALPLEHVDTKFVEDHAALLSDLLDCWYDGAVTRSGGLLDWLDCRENPRGWLQVRPLCQRSRERLAGLALLQLDMQTLREYPLPSTRILVVENYQSGYALPDLDDTIAVFGGGANIAWMDADWLRTRQIGYWGDIDSSGLTFLSTARRQQTHLQALMMDKDTLLKHQNRMVDDTDCKPLPAHLTEAEQQLFEDLRNRFYGKTRLEQERLAPDYVFRHLSVWLQTTTCASLGYDK